MRRILQALIAPCLLMLVSACSIGNFNSVYRTPNLANGNSLVLDAEQWAVLNIPQDGRPGAPEGSRVVCAMPSPDALTAAAARGDFCVSNPGAPGGGASFGTSEAAASIGLRTQSIQLMRDAMYRMCEAYAAGGLDAIEYGVMMRRFQSNMVAILAVEQLTGAIRVDQVELSAAIREVAREEEEAADDEADEEEDEAPATGNNGGNNNGGGKGAQSGVKADDEADDDEEEDDDAKEDEHSANTPLAERDPAEAITISQSVESITLAAMSSDYNTQMCFDMMRTYGIAEDETATLEATTPDDEYRERRVHSFREYCLGLLGRDLNNRLEADRNIRYMLTSLSGDHPPSVRHLRLIQALLAQMDQGWSSGDLREFPWAEEETEEEE